MTGLSVVSQTLCNIEVLPAFALPMMSTLNRTFGAREFGAGARDGGGEGDDGGGDGDGTGAGGVLKQQINCFAPIVRKYCEKKSGAMC